MRKRGIVVGVAVVALVGAGTLAFASGPRPMLTAGSGSVTLFYAKPFVTCTGADGDQYRQVLNWKGRGIVHSTYSFLNSRKLTDNVDFFQNVDSGKGLVTGTVELLDVTAASAKQVGAGTLTAALRHNVGSGQITIQPSAGGLYVLNAELRLTKVSNGFDVHFVFGKDASFSVPPNPAAHFNGQDCP
jgi:hypothetical protein